MDPEDDSKNLITTPEGGHGESSICPANSEGGLPDKYPTSQAQLNEADNSNSPQEVDIGGDTMAKESIYPNLSNDFAEHAQERDSLHPSADEVAIIDCEKDPSSEPVPVPVPPDGGMRAWLVMLGSFLCNGIIFGTINSGGVIFKELKKILVDKGVENPASYASLTLSLAIGTTFLLSMVAGVLTDKFGIRRTTITGGFLATLGMFLSSIFFTQEGILVFTMGIIFGVGASLAYTPSLVILGHYFRKRIGIVNGIVTAGSSIFTIGLTELIKRVIASHGLKAAFQILSGFMSILIICGIIFKPLLPDVKHANKSNRRPRDVLFKSKCRQFFGQFINFEIWKNKKYVIWTLVLPCALFGYFVPYVHLVEYASTVLGKNSMPESDSFTDSPLNSSLAEFENSTTSVPLSNVTEAVGDTQSEILVQCIGATSLLGRLLFGFLADIPGVNRILLQQISFFCIGVLTMLLTVANTFWMFVVITLGMGLFDGCFISLLGPIALDIVGPEGVSQAIGCLLGMCSIPLTLGPYIAGVMEDNLDSYVIPFLLAGIPPILGCFGLCLLKCVDEPPKDGSMPLQNKCEKEQETGHTQIPEAQALMEEKEAKIQKQEGGTADQENPKRFVVIQRESSI